MSLLTTGREGEVNYTEMVKQLSQEIPDADLVNGNDKDDAAKKTGDKSADEKPKSDDKSKSDTADKKETNDKDSCDSTCSGMDCSSDCKTESDSKNADNIIARKGQVVIYQKESNKPKITRCWSNRGQNNLYLWCLLK